MLEWLGVFFFFFIASNTHTEKKQKLHRINKVIKRKKQQTNSEFTHLHGNILTNIKIRYSNGNSIYGMEWLGVVKTGTV